MKKVAELLQNGKKKGNQTAALYIAMTFN